ncbi:hypothetical protein [Nocardia sp. NPDC059239]|uniref:hypothetical protein n=1 Tax=unclassified Nocardia TaxID=2637762 RepID=UPI0036B94316
MINDKHVTAALAFWQYCEASATWLFSTAADDENTAPAGEDGLVDFIRERGADGATRTEISRDFFGKNKKSHELDEELQSRLAAKKIRLDTKKNPSGRGRPVTRYYAITPD